MRIISLTFHGIGPFTSTTQIDFDRLSACSHLFLINGKTGSGKTTILDAIVFALYGRTSHDTRGGEINRMRSRFLDGNQDSWVELVFSVGNRILKIRRTPEYERAKKRGEGTTTKKSEVSLWDMTSGVQQDAIATGSRDVGIELSRLLPLNYQQFLQTVVLPQGAFAQFLHADSGERHQILQSIFRTELYQLLEEELQKRAREKRTTHQALLAGFYASLRSYHEKLIKLELPTELLENFENSFAECTSNPVIAPESTTWEQFHTASQAIFEKLKQIELSLSSQLEEKRKNRESFSEHYQNAVEIEKRLNLFTNLSAKKAQLESLKGQYELNRTQLDAHLRAEKSRDIERLLNASVNSLEEITTQVSALCNANGYLGQDEHLIDASEIDCLIETLENKQKKLQTHLQQLSPALAKIGKLNTSEKELRSSLHLRFELAKKLHNLGKESVGALLKLEELRIQKSKSRRLKYRLNCISKKLDDCNSFEHSVIQWKEDLELYRQELRAYQTHYDSWKQADTTYRNLQQLYFENAISEVARSIKPGKPCPACGSVEHPQIATPDTSSIDLKQFLEANSQRSTALGILEESRRKHYQHYLALCQKREQLKNLEPPEFRCRHRLQKLYDNLYQRLDSLSQSTTRISALQTQLETLLNQITHIREQCLRLTGLLKTQIHSRSEIIDELQSLFTQLDINAQSNQTSFDSSEVVLYLEETAAKYQSEDSAIQMILNKLIRLRQTLVNTSQQRLAFTQSLANNGFTDVASYQSSLLPEAKATELAQAVADYESEYSLVVNRLEDADLRNIAENPPAVPNLEELRVRLQEISNEWEQLAQQHGTFSANYQNYQEEYTNLASHRQLYLEKTADSQDLFDLADFAGGRQRVSNTTPLSSWVLQDLFAEVLLLANSHLESISSGRYQLQATTQRISPKKNQSLGVVVYDAEIDQNREIKTLSGGETFYCSLALALGLSEVITSQNAGVSIDTVFIDEGFGTLDDETRNSVISSLITTAKINQKTIGLISHVAELREIIGTQIQVIKSEHSGSIIRIIE